MPFPYGTINECCWVSVSSNYELLIMSQRQQLSRPMGKPTICIGENKGADQLRSNCEADQRLCFRYVDSAIPLLSKSKIASLYVAIFCDCTAQFVSDLFGNHIVGFPTRRLNYYSRYRNSFSGTPFLQLLHAS